jgi:hypothetical protein
MEDNTENNSWERTCAHFKDGYKNAQDAIRFVDTKTGVITGLIMLTTAAPFGVLKWSASLDEKYHASLVYFEQNHNSVYELILGGCILGITVGICGVMFGVEGLAPRSPKKYYQGIIGTFVRWMDIIRRRHKKKNDRPPVSVLFPFYKEKDEIAAAKHFHRAAKGLSEDDIIQEYAQQVGQVGRILCLKIESNRHSVLCFKLQLWIYLITSVLAYLAVTFHSL